MDSTAIELIAAERQRQISAEGWTPEHDDEHGGGALAAAAACYAAPAWCGLRGKAMTTPPNLWPWECRWWKPGDGSDAGRIRELVKAGALIAAEIERLQRAATHD